MRGFFAVLLLVCVVGVIWIVVMASRFERPPPGPSAALAQCFNAGIGTGHSQHDAWELCRIAGLNKDQYGRPMPEPDWRPETEVVDNVLRDKPRK